MIGIEISAKKTALHEYHYLAIYGVGDSEFPIARNRAWIVGRDNKSCDSLVQQIAEDIGKKKYRLFMGEGMTSKDKSRIEKYLSELR